MQSLYLQRIMKKIAAKGYKKTKPKQTQFPKSQKMNANAFSQKDYENETTFRPQKNKPNSNPVLSAACPERSRMGRMGQFQTAHLLVNRMSKVRCHIICSLFSALCLLPSVFCLLSMAAAIFNPIKKLTIARTGANLKDRRVIWRFGCF
ncbi:hypothetical protein ES707_15435 [subsurface metagenome]